MDNNQQRIYALKNLSPKMIATTFAKCSRSPLPFDQIASELTEENSADFNEKWVVNYEHGSVAEHAFFNIAIENVSLIAVELIQFNRLASFTEKSSRYQVYDENRIYIPKIFYANPHIKNTYLDAVQELFRVYKKSINPIQDAIFKLYPKNDSETEEAWKTKIKSKWINVCRFLLPNCVLANLGASMNARSWEYAITKLLSHPLHEVREIGNRIKDVSLGITPALVKYANPNQYYIDNETYLLDRADDLALTIASPEFTHENKLEVDLIDYDKDGENKVLAGLIYKYEAISYREAMNKVKSLSQTEKNKIFQKILDNAKDIYEKPPREFEYPYYTFDCLVDQGTYYDLKRNRMMTQTPQLLHGQYGYYTPKLFDEVGLGDDYRKAMDKAHDTALSIAKDYPYEAQYITTKATARRFIMKMNLREAFHFINTKNNKNKNIMCRKIAQMIFEQINKVHPNIAKYIVVHKN